MKILTRRELSYTTLKFTAGGLGEQLSEEDLKALSSYGEWILAKNEMIVSDGEEPVAGRSFERAIICIYQSASHANESVVL